jgi:hypothetical protein
MDLLQSGWMDLRPITKPRLTEEFLRDRDKATVRDEETGSFYTATDSDNYEEATSEESQSEGENIQETFFQAESHLGSSSLRRERLRP